MFKRSLLRLLPFWSFLALFKFGAVIHFTLEPVLGERVLTLPMVGLIIGGASLIQLILDVPAGYLVDRFGYIRMLEVTSVLFLATAATLFLPFSAAIFITTVFLSALGWLFFGPGVNAFLLSYAPKDEAGRYLSLSEIFTSIGVVLATIAVPFLVQSSPRLIGGIVFLLLALAAISLRFTPSRHLRGQVPQNIPAHHYYVRRSYIKDSIRAFRKLNPASSILLLQGFSAAVFYAVIWFVIPVVIQQTGGIFGGGLAVFDLTVILLGAFFGMLADRYHKRTLIVGGLLLFSIAGALIGFRLGVWFLLLGFLATAGDELADISAWAWLDVLDTNHSKDGLVSGLISMSSDLGWTVGPLIGGFLFMPLGPAWTITVAAVFLFATWILALVLTSHPTLQQAQLAKAWARPTRKKHKH